MIRIENVTLEPRHNESILECLLRNGMAPPYSCRSGLCQTCLMRAIHGKPTAQSQQGLKPSRVAQNYFLACRCIPQHDMEIAYVDNQLFRKATTIVEKSLLCDSVLRLRVTRPEDYSYFAGQYTTLYKSDLQGRSYSLASVPHLDNFLEFHIKLIPGGQVSQWLESEAAAGTPLSVSEALGNCMYIKEHTQRPMALIATGTGLSPVYGVLRDALHNDHQGEIHLYHGVGKSNELYLDQQLKNLTTEFDNLNYIPCVSRDEALPGVRQGRALDVALDQIGNFSNWSVYLSGNPDMVRQGQRKVFLAGASLNDIFTDPFLYG